MISGALNPKTYFRFMNLQYTIGIVSFRALSRIALLFLMWFPIMTFAQNDTIKYDIAVSGLISTGNNAPFWIQSRDYGVTSTVPQSAGLMLGINKDFNNNKPIFDYGFKANLLVRTDKLKSEIYFHELYAKLRFSVLDLIIGAREEHLGNQDSTLSCGGFLFSGNARPMPKLTIGIEHFVSVPFTKGFVEVKGAIAHGWFTDNSQQFYGF